MALAGSSIPLITVDSTIPSAIARPHRAPDLTRIRPGVYADTADWNNLAPVEQHLLMARTVYERTEVSPVWLSHVSAATAHGLPVLGEWPKPIHVTYRRSKGTRRQTGLIWHHASSEPPAALHLGLPLTSVPRTVADLARWYGADAGIIAADHALRLGLCDLDDLHSVLPDLRKHKGVARARWVAGFANGLAESPGESLSRVRIATAGVPTPQQQVAIYDDDGFIGRADFYWREFNAIGEFDGAIKYTSDSLQPGTPASKILHEEKRREDRFRRRGIQVIRWGWSDLWDQARFAARLWSQLRAGLPRR